MDAADPCEPANSRFAQSTDEDLERLLSEKDAANTKRSTKAAVQCLVQYLVAINKATDLGSYNVDDLASLLGAFYADARKKDGSKYKLSALKTMRFGLARHIITE